jgi:hypothetical protein
MKSNIDAVKSGFLWLAGMACLLWPAAPSAVAQVEPDEEPAPRVIESLVIAGEAFTNVKVFQQSATDIIIRHDGGITGFKVQQLDNPTLRRLGYDISPPAPKITTTARARLETLPDLIPPGTLRWGVLGLLTGLILLFVGICVYTGYVFRLICLKSGTRPGLAVWLPFLQAFPLLRAARMSWAWMLALTCLSVLLAYAAFRVPEHTAVLGALFAAATVGLAMVWSVRICHACGKSSVFAVLLLLPGLNYLALVYLASSR